MTNISKLFNVQSLLWLALILALAGSLKHLAAIFASIDGNTFFGWLQAVAIDAGLFALAYSIKVRKVARRSVKPLWFGVIVFSGISIYGNLAYGLLATYKMLPGWIVVTRPYILAASLPVLVLFLSELLSDDRQHMAKVAAREAKKEEKALAIRGVQVATPATNGKLAEVNNDRLAIKAAKQGQLVTIHRQKPEATITELASLLDVSRGTIRNYGKELGLEFATNGKNGARQ
jgi:cation transport ATPase